MNCAHARTQNARKRPETEKKRQLFMLESTFHKDGDEIGSNRAKKGHLVLESTIFELFCLQNSLIVGVQPQVSGKVGSLVGSFLGGQCSAFPTTVEFYRKASCRGRNKNADENARKILLLKCPDFIRLMLDIYISNRNGWLPCGRLP